MPVRLLREGILESERVDQLSAGAEVFYRRGMSKVDDHGRYYAKSGLLIAALYPLRIGKVRTGQIAAWLAECLNARLIRTYTVDGKQYLEYLDFRQQRRSKSKFPQPDESQPQRAWEASAQQPLADAQQPLADAKQLLADAHLVVSSNSDANAGPRGPRSHTPGFARFWETWPSSPRKVAKARCVETWVKRGLEDLAETIATHVAALKSTKQWRDGYEPAPMTYLNQRRWEDGLPSDRRDGNGADQERRLAI